MGKGRTHPARSWKRPAPWLLATGGLLVIGGLFLPWISVDAGGVLPVLGDLLQEIGALPADEPVAGYRIPELLRESRESLILQSSLALSELLRGRPDRAAARALFGERFPENLAILVLLPALLALLHLLLWRFPQSCLLALVLAGIDLGALILGLLGLQQTVSPEEATPLMVLPGIPATLLGLAGLTLGSWMHFCARRGRIHRRRRGG